MSSSIVSWPARVTARIGIVPRLLLGLVGALVLTVLVLDGWVASALSSAAREQALRQLDVSLGVLKLALRPLGDGFGADPSRGLTVGGTRVAGRNDVVDAVRDVTGATATIFSGLIRVATTVPKPDGSRAVGTALAPGPARQALSAGQTYRGQNTILGRDYATIYEPVRDAAGQQVGALYVGVPLTGINAEAARLLRQALLVGAAVAVGIGLLGWLAVRRTVRPLTTLAAQMRAVAGGALETRIAHTTRTDQIGQMAGALELLRDTAQRARAAEAAAEAERRARETATRAALRGMATAIATETGSAAREVARGSAGMQDVAQAIAAAAERSRDEAGRAALATGNALRATQSAAGSAEQLSAAITAISDQVARSSRIVTQAVGTGQAARTLFETLHQQIVRVGAVADIIAAIAGRTNLLALNAAIEAARAGEQGRGFAVVANEVKALAVQTARSTEEIARNITEVRSAAAQAAAAIGDIEASIGRVDGIATAIGTSVEQQASATASIARDMGDTARSMHEAAARIEQVSDEVRQTSAHATAVHAHAGQLLASVTSLRDTVARALGESAGPGDARDAA